MAEPTEEEVLENEEEVEGTEEIVEEEEKEEKVPVRNNVISAQRRIIEKLQKTSPKKESEDDNEGELSELARKLIESEVAKRVAPLNDEIEFRDYFSEHPEDKKFQKAARARFDAWGNVPIGEIMKTLRTEITPKERTEAVEKAKSGSMKGSSARKGDEDTTPKTQKDFDEIYKQVKRGNTKGALKSLGIQ